MQITLNVVDVLHAAIMLEDRGARFYADAAATFTGSEQKLLLQLAEMEQGHALAFRNLLLDLEKGQPNRRGQIDAENREYLEALTSDRLTTSDCAIKKGDSYEAILGKAMLIEKNSVFFYTAVKETLREKMAVEQVDHLIAEELDHFIMLSGALARIAERQSKL